MSDPAPLGIVTGLKFEAAILKRQCAGLGAASPLIACAAGRADAAEHAAVDMLENGAQALISFGIAGALEPALGAGTLILPCEIAAPELKTLSVDQPWRDRFEAFISSALPVSSTRLVSVAEPAASPAAKRFLADTTGAGAVDMESWAVAKVAADRNVPFLAIRAIADEAGQGLPGAALVAMQSDGSISIGHVVRALMRAPWETGALLRLGRNNKRAKTSLTRVAQSGLPRFELG